MDNKAGDSGNVCIGMTSWVKIKQRSFEGNKRENEMRKDSKKK